MNALEHIVFVLCRAVEADEIGKAELLRILQELLGGAIETEAEGDNEKFQRLNVKMHKRFRHVIHPPVEGQ
jgi:hypothetical protein